MNQTRSSKIIKLLKKTIFLIFVLSFIHTEINSIIWLYKELGFPVDVFVLMITPYSFVCGCCAYLLKIHLWD